MNKKETIQRCRNILYSKEITEQDKIFLRELLKEHPDYNQKVGIGIEDFFIRRTIYGTLGFNILRFDGSTTDFSFLQCITPKSSFTKLKLACRSAIYPTIQSMKTNKNNIIHHKNISFDRIVLNWLKIQKTKVLKLNPSQDNSQEIFFIDKKVSQSFIDYHNLVAELEELTIEEHKQLHKSPQEKLK